MKEREVFLSLGANLGEREKTLRRALSLLQEAEGITLCRVSSFYETAPWGKLDQPAFINAAAKLRISLSPVELLHRCQEIERALGRVRHEHWGARTIDIDLLFMEGVSSDTEELHLPHPYMKERAFVLVPLAEIAGGCLMGEKSVQELLKSCRDTSDVTKCGGSPVDFGLKMIACVDKKGGIGKDGKLLFSMPKDLQNFRKITMGHTVIMGRRTMESLPKKLAGRRSIVLSRTVREMDGYEVCTDLEELWEKLADGGAEGFVIGGGELYAGLLPYTKELLLTQVEEDGGADTFFPSFAGDFCLKEESAEFDEATGRSFKFCHYVRALEG